MDNIYRSIMSEYERRRNAAIYDAEARKKHAYETMPQLASVDDEIRKLGLKYSRSILLSNTQNDAEFAAEELLCLIEELKNKRGNILMQAGLPDDYYNPQYKCSTCEDTGYVGKVPYLERCSCFKQQLINAAYRQSNLTSIENENFDSFDEKLFSDAVNEEKYGTKKSPRENILDIKSRCIQFIDNFDAPGGKSLLFSGGAGVGKTFMSNCIACEILNKGKTVLYQTAPILFNLINEYKVKCFNNEASDSNIYNDLFETDLLIIDDLGTETATNAKITDLFTIINTRILNNSRKSCRTIISTNLGIREMLDTYTDRVVSRIGGAFNLYKFIGEDLRNIRNC